MRTIVGSRPSPSLVISMLALFVALTGTATALNGQSVIDHNDLQPHVVHTGKIHGGAVTTPKLAGGAVTTAKLADGAVTNAKIDNGQVTTAKIAPAAVTFSRIAGGAVGTSRIAQGAVIADKLAGGAVTTPKLADRAVTNAKIDDGQVNAAKLSTNAVTTPKIAGGAVSTSRLAGRAVTVPKLNAATGVVTVNFGEIQGTICEEATVSAPGVTPSDNIILTLDHTVVTTNTSNTPGIVWFAKQHDVPGFFRVIACNINSAFDFNPPAAPLRYLAIHP
jgi:hypothetical protein